MNKLANNLGDALVLRPVRNAKRKLLSQLALNAKLALNCVLGAKLALRLQL
jgi:hypothetical protein